MFRSLNKPCVVLLEDIDTLNDTIIERGSSKASEANRKTLTHTLNLLNGVALKESIILIITTNYPDALDEALVRPGRIDQKVHFDTARSAELKDLFLVTYEFPKYTLTKENIYQLVRQFSEKILPEEFIVAEVQSHLF